jgi:hypothetical protein
MRLGILKGLSSRRVTALFYPVFDVQQRANSRRRSSELARRSLRRPSFASRKNSEGKEKIKP